MTRRRSKIVTKMDDVKYRQLFLVQYIDIIDYLHSSNSNMDNQCGIIKLNVGGQHYTTTKETLSRYPHSMLGAMFNGHITSALDEDGRYFIDRDGDMFQYILNFLRSSHLSLPADFKQLDLLSVEADFYQIEPLIGSIKKLREPNKVMQIFIEVTEVRIGSTATMPTNNSRVVTILSSRRDVVSTLPQDLFRPGAQSRLSINSSEMDFIELELLGSNARLRLAEYLTNNDWTLSATDMSTSSSYDAKSIMPNSIIVEISYRDRWVKTIEAIVGCPRPPPHNLTWGTADKGDGQGTTQDIQLESLSYQ